MKTTETNTAASNVSAASSPVPETRDLTAHRLAIKVINLGGSCEARGVKPRESKPFQTGLRMLFFKIVLINYLG